MTPHLLYLRQEVRGSRTKLLGQADAFGKRKLLHVLYCHVGFLRLLKEPDALLLAMQESNLSRIQYTPVKFFQRTTIVIQQKRQNVKVFFTGVFPKLKAEACPGRNFFHK